MQFFRLLRAYRAVRLLGLLFAYGLVLNALVMPLHALASALPDQGVVLCVTDQTAAHTDAAGSGDPQQRHGCEVGCSAPIAVLDVGADNKSFTRLIFEPVFLRLPKSQMAVSGTHVISLLARGKAPGAPPFVNA